MSKREEQIINDAEKLKVLEKLKNLLSSLDQPGLIKVSFLTQNPNSISIDPRTNSLCCGRFSEENQMEQSFIDRIFKAAEKEIKLLKNELGLE